MTPSDWIAIGALIVAVASIVFNYLTNRENLKAKRSELIAEKSLEIYRELVEKLMYFNYAISKLKLNPSMDNMNHVIEDANYIYNEFIPKHYLYFPKAIIDNVYRVMDKCFEIAKNTDGKDKVEIEPWINLQPEIVELGENTKKYIRSLE